MTTPATIQKDAYYDREAIRKTLGLTRNAVQVATRSGELRSIKRGGRVFIRGDWIEAWLAPSDQRQLEGVR